MTDDVVAFLRAALTEAEAQAPHAHLRGCFAWDDYHYRHGLTDLQPTARDACECNGPERAAARVQAERAMVAVYAAALDDDAPPMALRAPHSAVWTYELDEVIRSLAYGHRHTVPGWREEWAPEGVEVTA